METPIKPHTVRYTDEAAITTAKRYIADNIERAPTVREVAAYTFVSPRHLTRLFQLSTDMTPGEYIAAARIERIVALLRNPALSLSEISTQMHFSSECYFNSYFKKHIGIPPGEYRRRSG